MENFTPDLKVQTPDLSTPKPTSSSSVVITLIVALLAGFAGYLLGQRDLLKQANPNHVLNPDSVNVSVTPNPQTGTAPTTEVTVIPTKHTNPNGNTFTSDKFGITFDYAKNLDKITTVGVLAENNFIYVYISNSKPQSGQYLEVFDKNPTDSLEAAITKKFLANIPKSDCFVKMLTNKNLPPNYQTATIAYPVPTDSENPPFTYGEKCPQTYSQSNGISYFVYNPSYPARFLFESIGQYGIPAYDNQPEGLMWQDTLQIFK